VSVKIKCKECGCDEFRYTTNGYECFICMNNVGFPDKEIGCREDEP